MAAARGSLVGLELTKAFDQLNDARMRTRELIRAYSTWLASGGVTVFAQRDPKLARYVWHLQVPAASQQDLPQRVQEIICDIVAGINGVALAVYFACGGDPTPGVAASVRFPIVTVAAHWKSTVGGCLPGASGPLLAAVKAVQPFARRGADSPALAQLAALVGDDGPHRLSLFAVAEFPDDLQRSAVGSGQRIIAEAVVPGPLVAHGVDTELACVYLADMAATPGAALTWSVAVDFHTPPRPRVEFGLRTTNGAAIMLFSIKSLVADITRVVTGLSESIDVV